MSTTPATAVVTYTPPDAEALERRAKGVLGMVNAFTIDCDDDYVMGGEELASVKRRYAAIKEQEVKITAPITEALRSTRDMFRPALETLARADELWKQKLLAYRAKIAAAAAEAQRIAEIAAQAERDRLAAEAVDIKRKADEEIANLPVDPATGEINTAAIESIRQTALFEAQAIEQTAAVIVAAPVAAEQPKVRGLSVAKGLDWDVSDHVAFVKFVAANVDANPDLGYYLVIDSVKMRARVKASGTNLNFPGIVVTPKSTMRSSK